MVVLQTCNLNYAQEQIIYILSCKFLWRSITSGRESELEKGSSSNNLIGDAESLKSVAVGRGVRVD